MDYTKEETDDTWYYLPPLPTYVIMSLRDAMQVLTNGVLRSGWHRVISPLGNQAKHDRYSVLLTARPEEDTPMRRFESSMIPMGEQPEGKVLTAKEWGVQQVLKLVHDMQNQAERATSRPVKEQGRWLEVLSSDVVMSFTNLSL